MDWIKSKMTIGSVSFSKGGVACSLIAFLIYLTAINHGFVLDDKLVITSNTHIQQGIMGIPALLRYNYAHGHNEYNDGLYRPISLVSFAAEQGLHKLNPKALHFTQALLYAVLILLLYLWLSLLFQSHSEAVFWAVLLFAVHPIHTEVVANIKSRDEIFASIFFATSAWQFCLWVNHKKLSSIILSAWCMLMACFSKESAVTFAVIFPLMAYYQGAIWRDTAKAFGIMLIPTFLFLLVRFLVLNRLGEVDSGVSNLLQNSLLEIGGWPERIATAASIQGLYIQKLFIPFQLSHDYSFNAIPVIGFDSLIGIAWLAAIFTLVVFAVMGLRQKRVWAFGIWFYFITIAVVANVFLLIGAMAAERFVFTPALGWCIAVVFSLFAIKSASRYRRHLLTLIALTFGILTLLRIPDWKSNYALFTADAEVVPNSARAHYNAGTALSERALEKPKETPKSLAKAELHLRKAIEIWPEYQDAYNNLGIAYMNARKYQEAYGLFTQFIKKFPAYNKARYNMGMTCHRLEKYAEAELHLELYLASYPQNVAALLHAAEAEGHQNKFQEAIDHLEQLTAIDDKNANAFMKLGIAHGILNQHEKAYAHLSTASKLAPNDADIKINMAVYYLSTGRIPEAKSQLEACLLHHPRNQKALELMQSISAD